MNPRQRRGVLLIGVAAIGALAVFLMVVNYVAEVQAQVGPVARAVTLTEQVPAHVPMSADMLREVEMPERWLPAGAIRSPQEVLGLVSPSDLPAGTILQDGMVQDSPDIEVGERELAILVDAETGVAGKIRPGSVVDVIATFPGERDGEVASARYVIQGVTIIDVGTPTTAADEAAGGFAEGRVVPVTFKLTTAEALRLSYVETFASTVRLTLRSPLDDRELDPPDAQYAPRADEAFIPSEEPSADPPEDAPPSPGPQAPAEEVS